MKCNECKERNADFVWTDAVGQIFAACDIHPDYLPLPLENRQPVLDFAKAGIDVCRSCGKMPATVEYHPADDRVLALCKDCSEVTERVARNKKRGGDGEWG